MPKKGQKFEPELPQDFKADFSPDECKRRFDETLRRCCGMDSSFSLETGQPYEGEQLSQTELKRRGY